MQSAEEKSADPKAPAIRPRLMRLSAACQYSGLSLSSLYRKKRELGISWVKDGRSAFIETDDVDRIIDSLRRA